jgi:hypothetical protein
MHDKTLRSPLPSWRCRLCKAPLDSLILRLDPGAIHCWVCKWKLEEALNGRR